jgi:membrane protease YdiL (CAAX protease family)
MKKISIGSMWIQLKKGVRRRFLPRRAVRNRRKIQPPVVDSQAGTMPEPPARTTGGWRKFWNGRAEGFRIRLADPAFSNLLIGLGYLLFISVAEAMTTLADPQTGMILHATVLVALLVHGSLVHKGPLRRMLITLTLAPLVRLLSLSIPLAKLGLPIIYWYLIIGAPLFLGTFVAGRVTDLSGDRIGWTMRIWPQQILLGLSGIVLGYAEYLILRPGPLADYLDAVDILTASFILLVFTGLLEELIFRGLMQSAAMQVMGRFGLVYIAILFAVLHLGYHSLLDLVFVLGVGLLFGIMVWKTGSLLGASLSHGIANISLYVFFPFLLAAGAVPNTSMENPAPPAAAVSPTPGAPSDATPAPILEWIVDDTDSGFLRVGGNCRTDAIRGFNNSFCWAYSAQSVPDLVVTWLPALPGCGIYNVEVHIPDVAGATESANYQVNYRSGRAQVRISQAAHRGEWTALGIFDFEPGSPASLQLSNLTGDEPRLMRWVGFDAARWIYIAPCGEVLSAP